MKREAEWKPAVSGPSEVALAMYQADYERSGYETKYVREQGVTRLYVRMKG